MKKLLLLFFIISLDSNSQAPYYKLLANNVTDWYIFNAMIPISYSPKPGLAILNAPPVNWGKYTAKTDTQINTLLFIKNYKKFFYSNSHVGYIREDTVSRKVYFLDKTSFVEDLLYDFSLNVGDSVYYSFPQPSGTFPYGYYKVKSITNVTTVIGVRKLFNLKKTGTPTSDTLKYIESIGSIIHPVYLYDSNYWPGQFLWAATCKYPYYLGLACKWSDNLKYFQSCTYTAALFNPCIFKLDSCNYWNTCSNVKENNIVRNLNISPNPSSYETILKIDLLSEINTTIEIYDISGRKVKTIINEKLLAGENSIKIDLTDFQNGYYFVRIKSKEFELNSPVIISR